MLQAYSLVLSAHAVDRAAVTFALEGAVMGSGASVAAWHVSFRYVSGEYWLGSW